MATLTTNISNISISVSGKNTQTATISWACPIVPAGMTITSCRLTGNASSFTTGNKGATLTINNTSVSSGSSFTINLGTGNNTTSVQASFVGAHKQSDTSVTLSNLVYTVEYTEPLPTYTVTFKDWDGSVLKTQSVESGSAATAPSNPSREGYEFIGWDIDFSNVTTDLTVVAQYKALGDVLQIKENGNWTNIGKVYKRVSGNWIEQDNSNWDELFNSNFYYLRVSAPMAALYNNGILIFTQEHKINNSSEDIVETYTGWETDLYEYAQDRPWYSQKDNISKIIINYGKPISLRAWFSSMPSLTEIDFTGLDTSNVTTMRFAFSNSTALTSLDLSSFDTSNVTDMQQIFRGCTSLTSLNLSSFNTSNVTDMSNMFDRCSNLTSLDLSSFDTSSVTNIGYMFDSCSNLTSLDLSSFDTSSANMMNRMFYGCSSLVFLDLSDFDTGKVTTMYGMFYNCSSLTSLNVSNFDTSNVTDMGLMFAYCSKLISLDLSNFDMTNVTNTNYMFNSCTSLQTIYVKDETAKTKIEASTGFPTGVSVIIGKPN